MKQDINTIRHTLAHVMAYAVKEIYPNVKFGIGPVIEDGFYYDFDLDQSLSEKDFKEIEKKMKRIINDKIEVEHLYISIKKAISDARVQGQKYKLEILEEIEKGERLSADLDTEQLKAGKASFYKIEKFTDLCKGPHVSNTGDLPKDSFKLIRTAGAYWRSNEQNPQLQRIYAVAFENKKQLDTHIKLLEESKKRDHKKLGVDLDLFTFSDLVGSGLPLFTPKGTLIRNMLDDYVWQLRQGLGYMQVDIPHITKKDLYEKSGHWDKFGDELFQIKTREGHHFVVKPMNCPHHAQIYARKPHSYREMPQRYANTTKVYRDEQTGELSGLSRVRSITQDDAHVFCRATQVKEEITKIWDIIDKFYDAAGFSLKVRLSLGNPKNQENYLGTPKIWKDTEGKLRLIIKQRKIKAEEAVGEASFYGPKIDFIAKDSLNREWQVATIQLDMNLPERFDLSCINEKGDKERVVMIHAAIMGSIERYMSILIEHFAGAFPLWLSPVQVKVLPISEKQNKWAEKISNELVKNNIRSEVDLNNDTLGKKIRGAELEKIPYILIIGDKEIKNKSVSIRKRKEGDLGQAKIKDFIKKISKEIESKKP